MAVIGNAPFQGLVSGGNIIDASIEGVDLSTSAIAARLGYTPVDPGAAAIIGGTINGTTIGATTAASGRFTTVLASGAVTLNGLTASTALALDASKNLVSVTNTGSGNNVLATSPTLVTPVLGTPTSGNFSTGTFTWPTFNQSTTGTAAGLSATLATASGGTGLTSFTSGGVVYASSTSALATGSGLTFDGTTLGSTGGVKVTGPASTFAIDGGTLDYSSNVTRLAAGRAGGNYSQLDLYVAGASGVTKRFSSFYNTVFAWYGENGTSELMRLDATGLGIGTTNPTAQLEIGRSSTSGYSTLRLSNSGTSGRTYEIGLGGNTAAAGYANNLYFYDSTAAVNRMVLTSAGNLGVGTSNTDARVDAEVSSGNAYRAYKSTTGGFTAYRLYTSNENVIGTIGVSSTNDNFYLGYGTTPVLTWNSSGTVTINGGGLNLGSGGTNGYFSGGTWYGINSGDWSFQAGNGSQNFIWKNSSGSSLMTLDTSGRLLIGTTNADVGGSVDGTVIRPTTGIATAISTTDFYSYTIYADRRGTNNTGKILAMGLGGYLKASIGVVGSNNVANDGGITFNTISGNDTQVQQMRIDANGVVFGYNLATSATLTKTFATVHSAANRGGSIRFGLDDGSFGGMIVKNVASTNPSFNSQYIEFHTHEGGISANERMRITATGNVLVGGTAQTSGNEKLLVQNYANYDSSVAVGIYAGAIGNKDINFYSNGNSQFFTAARIRVKSQAYTDEGNLSFWTTSNNGANVLTDSQKMVILANGNVGINHTVPNTKLDIKGDTNTFGGMAKIYLTDSNSEATSRNWSIGNGGSAFGALTFAVSATKDGNPGDGAGYNALVLNKNGAVSLFGANVSANGVGLVFPATQSASSDANTLDDYEEGTWNPTPGGLTSVNYSDRNGSYVKVGKIVTVFWDFAISSSSGTGTAFLYGLPFPVSGGQAGYSVMQHRDSSIIAGGSAGTILKGFADKGQVYLVLQLDNSGTNGFGFSNNTTYLNSGRHTGYCTYTAAD